MESLKAHCSGLVVREKAAWQAAGEARKIWMISSRRAK